MTVMGYVRRRGTSCRGSFYADHKLPYSVTAYTRDRVVFTSRVCAFGGFRFSGSGLSFLYFEDERFGVNFLGTYDFARLTVQTETREETDDCNCMASRNEIA